MAEKNKLRINLISEMVEAFLKSDGKLDSIEVKELTTKLINLIESTSPTTGDMSIVEIEALVQKYDSAEIRALKLDIKEILEKDTIKAMKELKNRLRDDCSLFDDITGLIARYNRIDKYLHKGTIKYGDAHIEFTKIDNSVIMMVNEVGKDDLKK